MASCDQNLVWVFDATLLFCQDALKDFVSHLDTTEVAEKFSMEIQRKEIIRNMTTDRKRAQCDVGGHVTPPVEMLTVSKFLENNRGGWQVSIIGTY